MPDCRFCIKIGDGVSRVTSQTRMEGSDNVQRLLFTSLISVSLSNSTPTELCWNAAWMDGKWFTGGYATTFRTLAWVRALRHKGVRIAEPPAELFDVEMNADCTIFPEGKKPDVIVQYEKKRKMIMTGLPQIFLSKIQILVSNWHMLSLRDCISSLIIATFSFYHSIREKKNNRQRIFKHYSSQNRTENGSSMQGRLQGGGHCHPDTISAPSTGPPLCVVF